MIATLNNWGHSKIDCNIIHITANAFGLFDINIEEILKHQSIQIQHLLNSNIHFSTSDQKYSQIFNNIKNNFDIHENNNSIVSFLISINKNLKKKIKKRYIKVQK